MAADAPPDPEPRPSREPTTANSITAWQLPVELLLQCLKTADLGTRIRASHVSRAWREAGLAERRLWDNFACSRFRDNQHEDPMFSLLEAMLLRSRPLPFHLTVPHLDGRPGYDYTARLLGLKELDVFRLAAYHGPTRLFRLLNPTCAPLPNLLCLDILQFPSDGDPDITTIDLTGQFGARCLPNLRELAAPNVRFPADGAPFGGLQAVTLDGIYGHHHRGLFRHCPSLVSMIISNSARSTPLPDPPLPLSLEEVSIGCSPSSEIDLLALMDHWRGLRVRRLVSRQVYSLEGVLPLLFAVHTHHRIELRMHRRHKVLTLSAIPDEGADVCAWTIAQSPMCTKFLARLETGACPRLTSGSVSMSQLGDLFIAQLQCPGLERLEFRLNGKQDWPLLKAHDDDFFIRAPRLQHIVFAVDAARAEYEEIHRVLSVLRVSLRALIRYDADLLESLTVAAAARTVREMDCGAFARFAKVYTVYEEA